MLTDLVRDTKYQKSRRNAKAAITPEKNKENSRERKEIDLQGPVSYETSQNA